MCVKKRNLIEEVKRMKTATILASLVASAAAFAPQSSQQSVSGNKVATSSSLSAFESELGAQEPLGFYDPLGFVEDGDQAKFERLRYVELKPGRISMLAFLGQLVTRAGLHLPGNIDLSGDSFDSFPDGWGHLRTGRDPVGGRRADRPLRWIAGIGRDEGRDRRGRI